MSNNPLLIGQGLPPFDQIKTDHIVPAITQLLTELELELSTLENQVGSTWEKLVEPLEKITARLDWTWGIINHLMGVKNTPELREAHQQVQPQIIQFYNRINQSKPLYQAFKALKNSENWSALVPAQQRIVETAIKDAELAGVGLEGAEREKFNQIELELAEVSTQFGNNIMDATKAFSLTLTTPEEIAGLPPSLLSLAAQNARQADQENATAETGPWRITLDFPCYLPFMQHSQRRDLREKLYQAFISRSSTGDLNNYPLIERNLALKQAKAKLLGFDSYAELSLMKKMAPSVGAIENLLEELRQVSFAAATEELAALKEFATHHQNLEVNLGNGENNYELKPWDVSFWAERQREQKFDFTAEELRPYLAFPQVLAGLFNLIKRLFGVTISPAQEKVAVWHDDVSYFQIADETGKPIAYFYLDAYIRPGEKSGGAWAGSCLDRAKITDHHATTIRLPVGYVVCNQTPPIDGKPSLMTFNEVITLFHEFGHGLQHTLTKVDYAGAAGANNIEWDAIELASQFMENWCHDRTTLLSMAKHYETGETLPEHYYQKLLAAKNYMSGTAMLRQLHFAFVDMELHHRYQPGGKETVIDVRNRIAKNTTILPPIPEDAFLCAFSHIFANGYAAGYYSYKWAEVLSADAFAAFEEQGLENEKAIALTGKRFLDTVLSLGGSQHPMAVFKAFRGREPSTEPLLRHSGLMAA